MVLIPAMAVVTKSVGFGLRGARGISQRLFWQGHLVVSII
jgi:hypothetical protein